MTEPANHEVDKLIASGIIKPDDHPTTHCSAAHFVAKKNGEARLVTDFRHITQMLRRPTKPFAGSEQIKRDLNPLAKCYAVIDMTAGYYQIPLKEEFRDLTTFILPC